jgi:hypothetical protein
MTMAPMAAVGGVLVQHRLPVLAARHAIPRRLWARPTVAPLL